MATWASTPWREPWRSFVVSRRPERSGRAAGTRRGDGYDRAMDSLAAPRPKHLELQRDRALTVHWTDGRISIYPIAYLRKMPPSADARTLREEMARNPLTVLPATAGGA